MLAAVSLDPLGIALEASVDGVREEIAAFASLLSPGVLQQPVKSPRPLSLVDRYRDDPEGAALDQRLASGSDYFQISPDRGRLLYPLLSERHRHNDKSESRPRLFPFYRRDQPRSKPEHQSLLALEVLLMELGV